MDKIAQKANQARSSRGNTFETSIEKLLKVMKNNKKIKNFERSPKIYDGEFNPDFIVEKNNSKIVSIDSTTTARSDRLRGKQWDAYGTKKYYKGKKKIKINAVVVIQDHDISDSEKANFRRCKARVNLPNSALDEVLSIKELIKYIGK